MSSSPISAIPRFDPAEIRRTVEKAKAAGLITHATDAPAAPSAVRTAKPRPVVSLPTPGEVLPTVGPMRSVWTDVTPELAARWLENNFVNRPLVQDVVATYARDMLAGQWVPTHQGIAFSDTNALIDGQHRLSAIVRTGLTVRMMVTYGLPAKIEGREMTTMDAVDRGRARSVADQLKIQHGLANGTVIAAVCAGLGSLCCGERTRRLSVGQTLDIYRAFQAGVDFVVEHRSKTHGLRAAGVLAGFAFAMTAVDDKSAIAGAFLDLVKGRAKPGTAIGALHAFLTSPDAKLLTRGADRALAELVLQAIHLQELGEHVDVLQHDLAGVAHYRALQPERVAKIAAMFRLPEVAS